MDTVFGSAFCHCHDDEADAEAEGDAELMAELCMPPLSWDVTPILERDALILCNV